jgi:hypothetical protein
MLNEAETVTKFIHEQNYAKVRGLSLCAVTGDSRYSFTITRMAHPNHTIPEFQLSFQTLDEVSAFIEGWTRAGGG